MGSHWRNVKGGRRWEGTDFVGAALRYRDPIPIPGHRQRISGTNFEGEKKKGLRPRRGGGGTKIWDNPFRAGFSFRF